MQPGARASHNGTPYEAASGRVAIEAIDFAARTVRGTFAPITGGCLVGGKPALQITTGRFEK